MEDVVRIGFVSSRDPVRGMVQITYPDRDKMVTEPFPVLCFGNEFFIPEINDEVLVLHLSGDMSSGVVIGKLWNNVDIPQGEGEWHKTIGGAAFSVNNGIIKISASEVVLESSSGSIAVSEILELKRKVEALEAG